MTELAIYDGLELIGSIREKRDRVEAYDAEDNAIGVFVSREKAVSAVCAAHRGERAGRAA